MYFSDIFYHGSLAIQDKRKLKIEPDLYFLIPRFPGGNKMTEESCYILTFTILHTEA